MRGWKIGAAITVIVACSSSKRDGFNDAPESGAFAELKRKTG